MDNDAFSNANFPRPDQAWLQFDVTFNTQSRGAGATHASEFGSSWIAPGYVPPIQVDSTVELWDTPNALGCSALAGFPPNVLCYVNFTSHDNGVTYFQAYLGGSKLNPPIQSVPDARTHVTINWSAVIAHEISDGIVPPPQNGWAASQAGWRQSNDSVVAFEIRNDISGAGGPMGDIEIANYKLYPLIPK